MKLRNPGILLLLTLGLVCAGSARAAAVQPSPTDSLIGPPLPAASTVPAQKVDRDEARDAAVLDRPAVEDIELQMNADVLKYIEFFTGAGRSTFERWLKRSGRYMELFRTVLQREGLPPDLVHLCFVESGFNVNARSYASAVGPWQFMRSSALLFGLHVNQWVDERKDPEKSTVAAARYLKHLYTIFNDWPLALSAYNAGEGTILRAIKRQGTTNYWDLNLPRQTEDYVPQFMAALAISRDPVRYGFSDVELDDPMQFDELALKGAVDLRAIAKLADCTVEEIKELNPAVLRSAAKGANGVTMLRLPAGKSELVQQRLAEGAKLPAVDLAVKHRVRRGETLTGIAAEYSVSPKTLAKVNGISRTRPLARGMLLTVPASLRAPSPEILDPADDPSASTAYVPARNIGPPAIVQGNSDAEGRSTVTVKRGETLQMIADRYGVTVADIRRWNRLHSTAVRRGTRLQIRTGDAALAPATSDTDSVQIAALKPPHARGKGSRGQAGGGRTVVVQRGETLSSIAARHGVSIQALRRANQMQGSLVRAGQRLRLPG